jgi:hypothetical protein
MLPGLARVAAGTCGARGAGALRASGQRLRRRVRVRGGADVRPGAARRVDLPARAHLYALLQIWRSGAVPGGLVALVLRVAARSDTECGGWAVRGRMARCASTRCPGLRRRPAISSVAVLTLVEEGKQSGRSGESYIPRLRKPPSPQSMPTPRRAGQAADYHPGPATHTSGFSCGVRPSMNSMPGRRDWVRRRKRVQWLRRQGRVYLRCGGPARRTPPFVSQPGEAWVCGYDTGVLMRPWSR